VGRNYQSLIGAVPGVVGTGNVNSLGAITSNNLFIMDGVDTTDPTTGTFGSNLNFEAIQEVVTSTSAVSAEYGRGVGAIVNVVTKSGTNRFEGSFKYIFANDDWNAQNTTTNEVSGASLERVKFDTVNPVYAITGGGPIIKNKAFFFGAYEYSTNLTPQRQTVGQTPENYQQKTENKFFNVRGTVQLTSSQTAWIKYFESPTDGFVVDYWGAAAGEKAALTQQNQTADNWAGQWSGVFRGNLAIEAAAADYSSQLYVVPYEQGRLYSGAPIQNLADAKFYNGATFDGYTDRPRTQFNTSATWFKPVGQRTHNIKFGFDYQNVKSAAEFKYPNAQYYIANSFNQATAAIDPQSRRDYLTGDSTSNGNNYALFVRDKFDLHSRVSVEFGVRYEKQTGDSDVGAATVDTNVLAPRLSGSVALSEDGDTLLTASYGRFHANIIQGFSDAFANVPQQANYDNFTWNGSTYVFSNAVRIGGSSFQPNTDLKPYHVDEFTVGGQRELGRNQAATVRFISRTWGNIIDDVRTYNADNSINRQVVNYDAAEHTYRGVQFVYDRRFSGNWSASASYTYSRTRGNHFANNFTALGDYLDVQCRTTADLTVGNNGILPCSEVQNGANKYGAPIFDRPHNWKFNGTYVRPFGPTNLVLGMLGEAISKRRYEKTRTVNVLLPGTTTNAGPTATYFYNELGSDPVPGMEWFVDSSAELVWRIKDRNQVGFKFEFFNLFNLEGKTQSNNFVWCNTDVGTGCSAARANYGKATARGSYQTPRNYRFSAIFRF
jgi:outer membrane receptor protein involved in Fe transport